MRSIVDKLNETGSVAERVRSGRPRSAVTAEKIQQVSDLLEARPYTSIRTGMREVEMSLSSYYSAVQESGFHSFKPTKVVGLRGDDYNKRAENCSTFLTMIEQEPGILLVG
jgi:transposase